VKRGKAIRSLGFIAQRLYGREDVAWAYDIPSKLTLKQQDWALLWARHLIKIANERGIKTDDRRLLATIHIETRHNLMRGDDRGGHVLQKLVEASAAPDEGRVVCGWNYFKAK
jgi:hypothetical protein